MQSSQLHAIFLLLKSSLRFKPTYITILNLFPISIFLLLSVISFLNTKKIERKVLDENRVQKT